MRKWILVLVCLVALGGCSANRKLQAASIVRQCKADISKVELGEFKLDSLLFPSQKGGRAEAFPNANVLPLVQKLMNGELERPLGEIRLDLTLRVENRSKDSLWIDALDGTVALDTLLTTPLRLTRPVLLLPGVSEAPLQIRLPVDQRLFALESVKNYRLRGVARAALEANGQRVELEFDETKKLDSATVKSYMDAAKQAVVEQVLTGWAQSLM
jgi:hypothetical protein